MPKKRINLTIEDELYEQAKECAQDERRSISALFAVALEEHMKRKERTDGEKL